ncbi:hypothetical protein B5M47_01125 [candidate division CPR3 bacterium 4484_211]|uniref:Vacuolar sorting receptor thioredoxin-like domain-containing protein n=1 Tax=candidate division CPR3 bacterium 4484_211 TaxID=1968527 RepID=A0A1W9NYR8_UNCC3|nr:MAG: hypothetical protein B5M47_01125 [candidate division CPR3 bacterium 4484_211]
MTRIEKLLGATVIALVALLGGSFYTDGYKSIRSYIPLVADSQISAQEAKTKVLDYIVANFPLTKDQVNVDHISKEDGLYKLDITAQGQKVVSYLTPDGRMFFPQGYRVDEGTVAGSQSTPSPASQEIPKTGQPDVKLFTMAFCPYGNIAEKAMAPVAKLLANQIDIAPHYVVYSNYQGGGPKYCLDDESQYCSMHGVNELKEDIRELCIYKNNRDKYWDFVSKVNENCQVSNIETCWRPIAENLNLSASKIEDCLNTMGIEFSRQEQALNEKYRVTGSPTLIINGVRYKGQRTSEDYKKAICNAFTNPPEECQTKLTSETNPSSGSCQ